MSVSVESLVIPSVPQQSFFLASFSIFWAYLILVLQLVVGSSSCIFVQSMIAAVYYFLSSCTSALRAQDFRQASFNSMDLLRSSRALIQSFCFMKVRALFEQITALSFRLDGSILNASVYCSAASEYFCSLISSFPFSLRAYPFLAFSKLCLIFWLSGSSLMPSVKYFLALLLSPELSQMSPLKNRTSAGRLEESIFLNMAVASSMSPVLARISAFMIIRSLLSGIFPSKQLTELRLYLYQSFLRLQTARLQFFWRLTQSSQSFLVCGSFSSSRNFLKLVTASLNLSKFMAANALLRCALVKLGSILKARSQSSITSSYCLRMMLDAALLVQYEGSLGLSRMASVQASIALQYNLFLQKSFPSIFHSSAVFWTGGVGVSYGFYELCCGFYSFIGYFKYKEQVLNDLNRTLLECSGLPCRQPVFILC